MKVRPTFFCAVAILGSVCFGCSDGKQSLQPTAKTAPQVQPAAVTTHKVVDELTDLASVPTGEQKAPVAIEQTAAVEKPAPAEKKPAPLQNEYLPRTPFLPPDQVPPSASLTQQKGKSFVTQRATMWCIPSSIENAFRYVGITDTPQEKIIAGYCKMYGDRALGSLRRGGGLVPTRGMNDEQMAAAAKNCYFTNGNFNTFSRAAVTTVDLKSRGLEFEFVVTQNRDQFIERMKHAIANNWPFLMAYQVGGGNSHIVSVVGYDENSVRVFNPADGKTSNVPLSKFSPNPDFLILRPSAK